MASNSTIPLPSAPAGYNPFEYWRLFGNLYLNPSAGFGARIIVLLCLVGYSIVAGVVLLGIHVTDYRRRNKKFWLWRIVRSRNRMFIVGNQHLLTPLISLFTSCVFIGMLHNTWAGLHKRGSLSDDGAWHLAPWAALFAMQWIISWAALQAFVLVSADSLPDAAITASNLFFVVVGAIELAAMVTFVVLGTRNGRVLWRTNQRFLSYLDSQAGLWSEGTAISPAAMITATELFSAYVNRIRYSVALTRQVLILFSISALITALVNVGALGTILIVRRQIKLGYAHFAGLRTATEIPVLDEPVGWPGPGGGLLAPPCEMAEVGVSVTPATPALRNDLPLPAMEDGPAGPPRRRPSLIRLPSSPSHVSQASAGPSPNGSRAPSRARVRAMAAQEESGGLGRERAKNLQRLQRAEADLVTTGVAMIVLSVSVGALGIWTIVLLPRYETVAWAPYEMALLGGTWIYSAINAASLSVQTWTAWLNLSSPEPSLDTPGPAHLSPTGTGTVGIVSLPGLPNPRHLPDAAGALSFEGMLASNPVTPTHEKTKFNFSRRGSAQSSSSLGPVAEEGSVLDLSAFKKA